MTFKIGGFSSAQYYSFLNPDCPAKDPKVNRWLSHITLFSLSSLAVCVNRLAYFIVNRFAVYPNNHYLFQKFKSHQFSQISTKNEYDTIKKIFKIFKQCSEVDPNELKTIKESLKNVKKSLFENINDQSEDSSDQEHACSNQVTDSKSNSTDTSGLIDSKSDQKIQPPQSSLNHDLSKPLESEQSSSQKVIEDEEQDDLQGKNSQKGNQKSDESDSKKNFTKGVIDHQPADIPVIQVDLGLLTKDDKCDSQDFDMSGKQSNDLEIEDVLIDEDNFDEDKIDGDEEDKNNLTLEEELEVNSQLDSLLIDLNIHSPIKKGDEKNEEEDLDLGAHSGNPGEELTQSQVQQSLGESTLEHLRSLFDDLSQSQRGSLLVSQKHQDSTNAGVIKSTTIDLPKKLKDLLSQPFPLEKSKSINELFDKTPESEKALRNYQRVLYELLNFENKLRVENLVVDDNRFEDYITEANLAFERAFEEAIKLGADLHTEFQRTFPTHSPQLMNNGEVVCTVKQFDWMIDKISSQFPAIYHLAFDAPYYGIYQTRRIASLAQLIFIGPHVKSKPINSACFIRLSETENKSITPVECSQTNSPLLNKGSYIYSHFIHSHGPLEADEEKRKAQIGKLIAEYVKDWLKRDGTTIKFGGISIDGGRLGKSNKAEEWVSHVRDQYTASLLAMDKETLGEEIKNLLIDCPFVNLILNTYADEVEDTDWEKSCFPSSLMKKLFESEIRKVDSFSQLEKAIHQTIDNTNFKHSQDISILAQKSGYSENFIEPLIRIRVLYLIACLGQTAIEPVVREITNRAKLMVDPCTDELNQLLSCQSGDERILSFDSGFDHLNINVKTLFKDINSQRIVAQGYSSLDVSSINHYKKNATKTKNISLHNLSFSVYSSKTQIGYLTSQIIPQTLVDDVEKVMSDIASLPIVKKNQQFQLAKTKFSSDKSWLHMWKSFDVTPYRQYNEDVKNLETCLNHVKIFAACMNTLQTLHSFQQLTKDQLKKLHDAYLQVHEYFDHTIAMLEEVYPSDEYPDLFEIKNNFNQPLNFHNDEISKIFSTYQSTTSKLQPPSPTTTDSLIGKTAGSENKGIKKLLWDNTVGYLTNESSEVRYLRWKIERYEDLISAIQMNILSYINEESLGDLDNLIMEAKKDKAPTWLSKILPVLEFCNKKIRDDDDRLNPDYLNQVRQSYTEDFLDQLRCSANWAQQNSLEVGAQHVDAICGMLYTTLDLNSRCHKVFRTFIDLGKSLAKHPISSHHDLPQDSQFDLIRNLHQYHQQIKAVPNDAKAPLLMQWANSARGHLNGFWGMAFDPNRQSNLMHVLYQKVITHKGKNKNNTIFVKDIAMGTPTIEEGNGKARINPEYLGFLRHYKRNGLRHLYINHQNFIPKAWVEGNESVRCQVLHDLADQEFKDTFFVITLNQNSPFYSQDGHRLSSLNVRKTKDEMISQLLGKSKIKSFKNYLPQNLIAHPDVHKWMANEIDRLHREEFKNCVDFDDEKDRERFIDCFHEKFQCYLKKTYPNDQVGYSLYENSASNFKNELIRQVFDCTPQETGNYIPQDLVQRFDLRTWSIQAVDQIHQKMFGGRLGLSTEERRIFIRLFYQNLSQKVLLETEANSYNVSCKDRIDRGAASDAEDYAYHAILNNCTMHPHVIAFFEMMTFVRAIIVRKRSIIEERLVRLIETVKFMVVNQANLLELQKALFPDIEIAIDQFSAKDQHVM